MKVHILDDWFDTLRRLPCFARLKPQTRGILIAADPLVAHPHVIGTPHIGYVTEDEFDLQFADIFDQINAFAQGAPIHMINPEVWRGRL